MDTSDYPMISVVMRTYNRAHTVERAITSVLRQDYPALELIVVDDGSTDGTAAAVARYASDSRVRLVRHASRRGPAAALNTGLDIMHGEWFTSLDSDDEMTPHALSSMMQVVHDVDASIDAITCNCVDASTGKFSGTGLDHDQYLDVETMLRACRGEHWGITKSSLLGNLRLDEDISGGEGVLWYKISRAARRYYIHQGLRIYHTEGNDRLSRTRRFDLERIRQACFPMRLETEYLSALRKAAPDVYVSLVYNIGLVGVFDQRRDVAIAACNQLKSVQLRGFGRRGRLAVLLSGLVLGRRWLALLQSAIELCRPH